jgi:succinoglycan biosynthesis protein ExoA
MSNELPFVSLVMPMRNEAAHIESCLRTLLEQDYPRERMEIIVADGASEDGSREIVDRFAAEHPVVRVVDNPERVVPTGLNVAIRAARGEYVLRVDAHAEYACDYVSQCVAYLRKTGADNVGGPLITLPGADTREARCIAAITSHPVVVGGSRFRSSMAEEYADGAFFGAFPRDLFDRIGYFNEALVRHQDNEFNSRILQHGGKIFKTPKVVVRYYNQARLVGLLRQAFRNGQWHVLALLGNPASFKIRYFAPFGFDCGLIGFEVLSLWHPMFVWPLAIGGGAYLLVMALVAAQIAVKEGLGVACWVPLSMLSYHVVYGLGTFVGLVRFGLFGAEARRRAREGSLPPGARPAA